MHLEQNAEKEADAGRMRWSLCIGVQAFGTFLIQKGSALKRAEPFALSLSHVFIGRLLRLHLIVCRIAFFPLRKSQNRPADQLNDAHEKYKNEKSHRECIPKEQSRDRLRRKIGKEYPREIDRKIQNPPGQGQADTVAAEVAGDTAEKRTGHSKAVPYIITVAARIIFMIQSGSLPISE